MKLGEFTESLKENARNEGFDLVGVATAGPSEDASRFKGWLARGMHGEMSYMETTAAQRIDPRELLPGCRSSG